MKLLTLLLGIALPLRGTVAQLDFDQPEGGEVVNGGSTLVVRTGESLTAPYLFQMAQYELLLLSGNASSALDIYSWYLNDTNPMTVYNSIVIPSSAGPDADLSYFMAIRGALQVNSSIYVTYFSDRFTLTNMTGPTNSAFTAANSNLSDLQLKRLVTCGDPSGPVCNPTELAVLASEKDIATSLASEASISQPAVTTPPVAEKFSTTAMTSVLTTINGVATSMPVTTTVATTDYIIPPATTTPTSTAVTSSSDSDSTSGSKLPAMAYPVIIAGICLTAICVLFYIYTKYKRRHHDAHPPAKEMDCEKEIARERDNWWRWMQMPMFRSTELEVDRGRPELNEREARRSWWQRMHMPGFRPAELDTAKERAELNVEAGLSKVATPNTSEKTAMELEGSKVKSPRRSWDRRDLPPLPTDQTPCPGTEAVANARAGRGR